MLTQTEKGKNFRALHERDGTFIIPNPWDIGTARLLAHLGFEALATPNAGYTFSVGQRDYTIDRNRMIAHVADFMLKQLTDDTYLYKTCRIKIYPKIFQSQSVNIQRNTPVGLSLIGLKRLL